MIYISDKNLYKSNPELYNVLSDYILDNFSTEKIPISDTKPVAYLSVSLSDCYLDDFGNLYVPSLYEWVHRGTDDVDDPDEYLPKYTKSPTLSSLKVQNLLAEVTETDHKSLSHHI